MNIVWILIIVIWDFLYMHSPIISIIVAIDEKRGIGKNNRLLWNIPSDLNRFRTLTRGHACIMGRKTYESIGHPLPNRLNIVVTNNSQFASVGITIAKSLDQAINIAKKNEPKEIFIIGGAQIYAQALTWTDKLYLTIVNGNFDADAFFPEYKHIFNQIISSENYQENGFKFTFLTLTRNT